MQIVLFNMVFNCLIKKDNRVWIGHCLELDIVATGESVNLVKDELIDLILAQIDYAFSNDNLDNLYHPAPQEVWKEFYSYLILPQSSTIFTNFQNQFHP